MRWRISSVWMMNTWRNWGTDDLCDLGRWPKNNLGGRPLVSCAWPEVYGNTLALVL